MFQLGNFFVREVLFGVAENFDGDLLYTLDQLTSASIEVSSDPTEITDKNGNVVKQIFKNKTATLTASSALLSPNIMNAGSGSDIEKASSGAPIEAPKIVIVGAGQKVDVSDAIEGTISMIGMYGDGSNGKSYSFAETALLVSGGELTAPAAGDGEPTQYFVKYQRNMEAGVKLTNSADKFPQTVKLTLFVAIDAPCYDTPKAAYVVIPSFQADPSITVSLDSESTTVDFTGSLQLNTCSCTKELYYIVVADENAQVETACAAAVASI